MTKIEDLISDFKKIMPSSYQEDTLESIFGLLLQGKAQVPHDCQTKSESAISRFLNHYKWSTRSLIRKARSYIIDLILSQPRQGKKPILQVIVDLTTLEKVGKFPHLQNLVRVYNHKKGLHIVILYLVIGKWRIPWNFRVYRGKGTPSQSQLAAKLLRTLPSSLTKSFQIYVLGDTSFGTVDLLEQIRGDSFGHHAIVGISKNRTLIDGRKVSEIKTKGQQVYLNNLSFPVYLSWVWLKRDGKKIQRFVISTKPMKGKTITRWGKRRWQIEGFFKTSKHQFSLHRFGQKTLLGVYRWLVLSLIAYLLAHWVYLYLGSPDILDWSVNAQLALTLIFPHVFLLSILKKLELLIPWLYEQGFEFCLIRCKI